jgi:hypothetical protein
VLKRARFFALILVFTAGSDFVPKASALPPESNGPEEIVQSNSIIDIVPTQAVLDLLAGYDTLTNTPKRSCLVKVGREGPQEQKIFADSAQPKDAPDETNLTTRYVLNDVSEAHSMRTSVLHTLQASFDYAGTGSFGATSQSTTTTQYSEYSRSLSIDGFGEKQTRYETNVKLTSDAAALWGKPAAFRRRCGDRYIAAQVTGASFLALASFSESTSSESSSVNRAFSIAAKGAAASVQDLEEMNSLANDTKLSVQIITSAVSGEINPTFDGIVSASKRLREDAAKSTRVIREIGLPYPSPDNDTLPLRQESTLEALADQAITIRKRMNSLIFILNHAEDFPGSTLTRDAVKLELANEQTFVSTLLDRANDCARDITKCKVPHLDVPDLPGRPIWTPIKSEQIETLDGTASLFTSPREYPSKVQFNDGQWRLSPNAREGWMTVANSCQLQWKPYSGPEGHLDFPQPMRWYDIQPNTIVEVIFNANPHKDASVNTAKAINWKRYDDIPLKAMTLTDK